MVSKLWDACLNCSDKCCQWKIAYPLFVTKEEKEKLPEINSKPKYCGKGSCVYFTENELCGVHNNRPIDCRLYPFDILNLKGVLTWVIYDVNCPIFKNEQHNYKLYIHEHEKEIIPQFKEQLQEYSLFRLNEILTEHLFKVLRPMKLPTAVELRSI